MTKPPSAPGRALLLAAAGLLLGGAIAARAMKRRPAPPGCCSSPSSAAGPAQSAPPVATPSSPSAASHAPSSGPTPAGPPSPPHAASASLIRMAVGGAIVVVLALTTAVVTRPPSAAPPATERWVLTQGEISFGISGGGATPVHRDEGPFPVDRTETVTMTGADDTRAEVGIGTRTDFPRFTGLGDQQTVMFTIHIHNTGTSWFGTRLDLYARVVDTNGTGYAADQMLSLASGPYGSTDPELNPQWQLAPAGQVDRRLAFTVPPGTHLTTLGITLPLNGPVPSATWIL